jgi:hypothetical protein
MNRTETANPENWREPVGSGTPRTLADADVPAGDGIDESAAGEMLGYGGALPCRQLREAFSMGLLSAVTADGAAPWRFLRAEVERIAARQAASRSGKPLFFCRQTA